MTKISGSVVFYKVLLPLYWFGFLTAVAVLSMVGGTSWYFLLAPLAMMVLGFFVFRKMAWDLADEVYDAGEFLIFRKGGVEQTVKLDEIVNINSQMTAPERVTIRVRSPGPLGKELTFSPPYRFRWFSTPPIASDLIERVDRARRD